MNVFMIYVRDEDYYRMLPLEAGRFRTRRRARQGDGVSPLGY